MSLLGRSGGWLEAGFSGDGVQGKGRRLSPSPCQPRSDPRLVCQAPVSSRFLRRTAQGFSPRVVRGWCLPHDMPLLRRLCNPLRGLGQFMPNQGLVRKQQCQGAVPMLSDQNIAPRTDQDAPSLFFSICRYRL